MSARKVRKARAFDEENPIPPDALVVPSPETVKEMAEQQMTLRKMAKLLFVADAKENSIEWHWENDRDMRGAPLFKGHVPYPTFCSWAQRDAWYDAREEFWGHVEVQVLTNLRDEFTKAKIEELSVMTQSRAYLTEYLFPMKDPKTGEVKRHPVGHRLEGLPIFPLDLGNMPKFIEAFLKLDERMMLKRGEAISRTQGELEDIRIGVEASDPSAAGPAAGLARRMNFNADEVRAAATLLLQQKMQQGKEDVIDVGTNDDEDEGDEAL